MSIPTTTAKKITVLPPTRSLHPERDGVSPNREKIRVAAYCRVSTTLEEQQGSFKLQKDYYPKMIASNPAWELAGIYGDEGKSGTTISGRTGFLKMMDDVRMGKIDYIITKATSRFGRNNAEFITILEELESYGVEVLFESEGIMTSGQQNRTLLQVMGATNEHYSSTLSNNVRWSKEKSMKDGKVTISYKTFLGYKKGEDGSPVIDEEEAKIVRKIYELFLAGRSYTAIAKHLTNLSIPTPAGKEIWQASTIRSILTNEKYTGDAVLQKTFKRSYLDKRARKNQGEKAKVIVENNHPAIIDKSTFAKVQILVNKRTGRKNLGQGNSPFTNKIVCSECGERYGHRTWNSRGNIKYSMWVCNSKYHEDTAYSGSKCKTANLRQEWLETGYLYTMNGLLTDRAAILASCEDKLARIDKRLNSGNIERKLKALEAKRLGIEQDLAKLISNYEFTFGKNDEFMLKQAVLKNQALEVNQEAKAVEEKREAINAEKKNLQMFVNAFTKLPEKLTKFPGKEFLNTMDHIEVSASHVTFYLYNNQKIRHNINDLKLRSF